MTIYSTYINTKHSLLATAALVLFGTNVNAQQTGGAYPASFQLYSNCYDCSGDEIAQGTLPYGDNGCYNFGTYSARIECSSAYSNQYTANYYGDTGCGYLITTITGYGTGCVASGQNAYSNVVNCEYPAAPFPEADTSSPPPDPNAAVTASLSPPAVSTGTPSGTNTGQAASGSPPGFEGSVPTNSSSYGNQVSYGENGVLGGAIIGGKGATPSSQATTSAGSAGVAAYDGGINSPSLSPAQQAAQAYILANPAVTTAPQSSTTNNAVQTSDAHNYSAVYIFNMLCATMIACVAWAL